jgi:catechol 2,3-dioxygenase-like lactoylglutathione lyase family enzyme
MSKPGNIQSQITFLYYHEIEPIASFYEDVLGLELVEDQGWARIYRSSGNAFLGLVAGDRGFHKPQEKNAVLVTLAVADVPRWYRYLQDQGVKLLTEIIHSEEIQVQCFFFEDPGGYTYEVEQFLKPELSQVFHR